MRRVDLANWALRTSPKFTTGVKYQFHQGYWSVKRSGNPNHNLPSAILYIYIIAVIIIVCLVSKENLPAFIFKRSVCDQAGDDNKYPRFQKYLNALLPAHVTWIKEIVYYIMNLGQLARWRKWTACDVGEAKEGLENEPWRWWRDGKVGEWALL